MKTRHLTSGIFALLVILAMTCPVAASAAECTNTYTGPSEGAWATAANWSAEHVPTESDVACIGAGKTAKVTAGTNTVGLVQGEGELKVSAGSLELTSVSEASKINTFSLSSVGTLAGPGTLNVSNSFSWVGGTMNGTGSTVLLSGATGNIEGGEIGEGRTFINEGTLTFGFGVLPMGKGSRLENSGTFNVNSQSESGISRSTIEEPPVIVNTGTVRKTAGSETTNINVAFENEGSAEAQTGNLRFGSGGSGSGGSWSATEGASIRFAAGNFELTGGSLEGAVVVSKASLRTNGVEAINLSVGVEGSFSFPGTLDVQEGSLEISELTLGFRSFLDGPGTIEVTKSLSWASGTMNGTGSTVLLSGATGNIEGGEIGEGRTFINEGTLTFSNGALPMGKSSRLENSGIFNVNSESGSGISRGPIEEPPVIVNTGTFRKTAGSETTIINVNLENTGTVEAQSGQMRFGSSGSQSTGNWTAAKGAFMTLAGGVFDFTGGSLEGAVNIFAAAASIEGVETHNLSTEVKASFFVPASLEVPKGSVEFADLSLNFETTLKGAGTLNVSNSFSWFGGTMRGTGSTVLLPGGIGTIEGGSLSERTLVNEGTTTYQGSYVTMEENARLINSGTFNANSESGIGLAPEGPLAQSRIINTGTFRKTAGTGTTLVEVNFENLATVQQSSGTLSIPHPIREPTDHHAEKGCHSSAGDPVECATGNFTESQTDIAIGGFGVGLSLTRTYSAQAAATAISPGAFGYGWTSSFSDHLISEEGGKKITVVQGNGATVPFTEKAKETFSAPTWSQDILTGSSEVGYTLTLPEQTEYGFSGAGKLESLTDRNGNETTLAYEGSGRLETITDPASRQITLKYNGGGQVESAEDPMGHVVKYGYESSQLASVTMPGEAEPRWRFKYDGSHRITKVIDGRGGETLNEYNGSSRVISQTDPAGHKLTWEYAPFHTIVTNTSTGSVTDEWFTSNNEPFSITRGFGTASATTETFAYNAAGLLTSKTDGNGHKTTYGYDSDGNRKSEKDAAGDETKWTYNETHDVVSSTTPNNEKTTIERDANGNVESISRPGPEATTQTSTFEYDGNGQLEHVTDPLERTWTYGYDAQGDRTSESDPIGDTATYGYDEDSRLTSIVSPRGNLEEGEHAAEYTTRIERDPQGRVEEVIDPLGHATKYAYDGNGNLEAKTDANNHTTEYTYNADDERTEVKKPNGAVLETGYDGAGAVTSQTDANGKTTTYVRNVLEEPVEVIDPLERKTTEEFDDGGNLEIKIDQAEGETSYAYDAANRLKEVSYPGSSTSSAEFEYDPDGNVTSMVDGTGESSFEYDQLGRLKQSKDGHGSVVGYEYNLAEEQIGITYPNGKEVARKFDPAGRLESVTDWLGGKTTFAHDPDSNLETATFPTASGNKDEYTYDRTDRMSKATFLKGVETVASLSYEREKVGQIEEEVNKGLPGSEKVGYGYDENDRLTSAGGSSYEYDPADNLTKAPGTTNEYDAASQIETGTGVGYTFNELGDRTEAAPGSGPATSYEYDQAGNLTSILRPEEGAVPAINESFAYDGSGLMASRTSGLSTHYLSWDESTALPLLLSDGQNSYIYGPNSLPVEQISSGEAPTYLHHDQLGSTRLLTNSSGTTTATFSYGPYGAPVSHTGLGTTPLGFAGQYTDSESGLQYLRARFYDPMSSQFLTRDPMEDLTRSPYGYARQNPTSRVDPSGLCGVSSVGSFLESINPISEENCAYQAANSISLPSTREAAEAYVGFFDGGTAGLTKYLRDLLGIRNGGLELCGSTYNDAGVAGAAVFSVLAPLAPEGFLEIASRFPKASAWLVEHSDEVMQAKDAVEEYVKFFIGAK